MTSNWIFLFCGLESLLSFSMEESFDRGKDNSKRNCWIASLFVCTLSIVESRDCDVLNNTSDWLNNATFSPIILPLREIPVQRCRHQIAHKTEMILIVECCFLYFAHEINGDISYAVAAKQSFPLFLMSVDERSLDLDHSIKIFYVFVRPFRCPSVTSRSRMLTADHCTLFK